MRSFPSFGCCVLVGNNIIGPAAASIPGSDLFLPLLAFFRLRMGYRPNGLPSVASLRKPVGSDPGAQGVTVASHVATGFRILAPALVGHEPVEFDSSIAIDIISIAAAAATIGGF